MIGYIFMVENTANNKKYIGKHLSVVFDREYYGDNENLFDDVDKYGKENFKCTMLNAVEESKYIDEVYNIMLDKYHALTDPSFYNCVKTADVEEDKPKRTRKKKDESLS